MKRVLRVVPSFLLVGLVFAGCAQPEPEPQTPEIPTLPFDLSGLADALAQAAEATEAARDADAQSGDHPADQGDLRIAWPIPGAPSALALRDRLLAADTFDTLADMINAGLSLPQELLAGHTECGVANAFYDPSTQRIILCYEMLFLASYLFDSPDLSDAAHAEATISAWTFIFFHELGHALVDIMDLPITGREEDAVDDLATVLLISMGLPQMALMAAFFWYGLDDGQYDELSFAGEHSLSRQRFYQTLCTTYGSDPDEYDWLVAEGILPEDRAVRCPGEFEQKEAAWAHLLDPWRKPFDIDDMGDEVPFPESMPRPSRSIDPDGQGRIGILARDERIAIPAGDTIYHGFDAPGPLRVGYSAVAVDDSRFDVGVIDYDDVQAFANEGAHRLAGSASTQDASGEVDVPAGRYALAMRCLNTFFSCDVDYGLYLAEQPIDGVGARQIHANGEEIAIEAGDVFSHDVSLPDGGEIGYGVEVLDSSTVDVAIVRARDVDAYRAGQTVETWAAQADTQVADGTASMPAGDYALAIRCLNGFFDCNIQYALTSLR